MLLVAGCVGDTKLTDTERAKTIKEKRLEARDMIARYQASDAKDLESLEKAVDLHRENTELAPASCPRCWAEYGEALSMLGYHYWFLYNDVLRDLDSTRKGDRAALEQEAAEYRAEWEKYFSDSNRAYEAHFRSDGVSAVHPYSYERVMRHNEILGNYDRAIYYLEKYVEAYPMIGQMEESNRQRIERLRRLYRAEVAKQKEREIRGNKVPPPPVSIRAEREAKSGPRTGTSTPKGK